MSTVRVTVDFTNIQEADDGDTTRYGGSFVLDGEVRAGHGDDRSDNHVWDTVDHVIDKCAKAWPDDELDATDVVDAVEALDAGSIVVTRDGDRFVVTAEA